jgi:hypothetical protein
MSEGKRMHASVGSIWACAAWVSLLHYTRFLRIWRNWQTRYFEVVVE